MRRRSLSGLLAAVILVGLLPAAPVTALDTSSSSRGSGFDLFRAATALLGFRIPSLTDSTQTVSPAYYTTYTTSSTTSYFSTGVVTIFTNGSTLFSTTTRLTATALITYTTSSWIPDTTTTTQTTTTSTAPAYYASFLKPSGDLGDSVQIGVPYMLGWATNMNATSGNLTVERAVVPGTVEPATTCTNLQSWVVLTQIALPTGASAYSYTPSNALQCLRFRVVLTDGSARVTSTYSGVLSVVAGPTEPAFSSPAPGTKSGLRPGATYTLWWKRNTPTAPYSQTLIIEHQTLPTGDQPLAGCSQNVTSWGFVKSIPVSPSASSYNYIAAPAPECVRFRLLVVANAGDEGVSAQSGSLEILAGLPSPSFTAPAPGTIANVELGVDYLVKMTQGSTYDVDQLIQADVADGATCSATTTFVPGTPDPRETFTSEWSFPAASSRACVRFTTTIQDQFGHKSSAVSGLLQVGGEPRINAAFTSPGPGSVIIQPPSSSFTMRWSLEASGMTLSSQAIRIDQAQIGPLGCNGQLDWSPPSTAPRPLDLASRTYNYSIGAKPGTCQRGVLFANGKEVATSGAVWSDPIWPGASAVIGPNAPGGVLGAAAGSSLQLSWDEALLSPTAPATGRTLTLYTREVASAGICRAMRTGFSAVDKRVLGAGDVPLATSAASARGQAARLPVKVAQCFYAELKLAIGPAVKVFRSARYFTVAPYAKQKATRQAKKGLVRVPVGSNEVLTFLPSVDAANPATGDRILTTEWIPLAAADPASACVAADAKWELLRNNVVSASTRTVVLGSSSSCQRFTYKVPLVDGTSLTAVSPIYYVYAAPLLAWESLGDWAISGTAAWTERLTADRTVRGRTLVLYSSAPVNGACSPSAPRTKVLVVAGTANEGTASAAGGKATFTMPATTGRCFQLQVTVRDSAGKTSAPLLSEWLFRG